MPTGPTGLPEKGERLYHVIRELRERGASQREALRAIRDRPATGFGGQTGNNRIGDKTLRAVWHRLEDEERVARRLRYSKKSRIIAEDEIPLVPVAGDLVRGRFIYTLEVSGRTRDTGEKRTEYLSITSDETVSRGELEARASALALQADAGSAYSFRSSGLRTRLVRLSRRS